MADTLALAHSMTVLKTSFHRPLCRLFNRPKAQGDPKDRERWHTQCQRSTLGEDDRGSRGKQEDHPAGAELPCGAPTRQGYIGFVLRVGAHSIGR